MDFCIEDLRKKPVASLKQLIDVKIITLDQAKDWLRTIYEIRFFEEKVFDLLGQNIIKGASHLYAGEEAVMDYKFSDGTIGFDYLDAKPVCLAAADVPPPMSEPLELASIPSVETIVQAVKSVM
ncbi:MAG: hypothetical protein PHF37_01090 [Phycisphaerae bacterium]|nr:hypothetical protein [Phycisphaerae bacterium]